MSEPFTPWNNQPAFGTGGEYDDLAEFEKDFRPKHAFGTKIDSLTDGTYDCEIVAASLEKMKDTRILRVELKVAGGAQVEWMHWLTDQRGLNGLCADLTALGFDCPLWGEARGRPLPVELPKAVAMLPGRKFRGIKSSRKGSDGVTYHEMRILCPISKVTAAMPGPAQMQTPVPPAQPSPANHRAPVLSDAEIPF